LKLVQLKSLGAVSYSPSIITMALSCIISEIKRDISQNRHFFIPSWFYSEIKQDMSENRHWKKYLLTFDAPFGKYLWNIAIPFGTGKLEWYRQWKNFDNMFSRFCRIPACDRQTDGQMDKRTDGRTDILPQHSPGYTYASRGNYAKFSGFVCFVWTQCIMYHFRDKSRYWLKISSFSHPLHSRLQLGGRHRNIAISFSMGKLDWRGNPVVKKNLWICLAVSTEYRRVTDGLTSDDGIVCTMHSIAR